MIPMQYISFQAKHADKISEANIICLGNFDGVHLAHRTLWREAKKLKEEKLPHAKCGVLCFEKPSTDYFAKNPTKHLTTLEQKLQYFAEEGMDFALIIDFGAIKNLSPEEFVNDVLINQCACIATVCGYNYHFGKGGIGNYALLQQLLSPESAIVVPAVYQDADTVSSTRIRELLKLGKIKEANTLLTTPFSITSPVERGKGLGRHLGAPTFNQTPPKELLIPARGVYLTRCTVDSQTYYGLTNIGTHPTVDIDAPLNLETHLLEFEGNLYDKELRIEFLDYIRPEQRFESKEALQNQIQQDIKAVKERL